MLLLSRLCHTSRRPRGPFNFFSGEVKNAAPQAAISARARVRFRVQRRKLLQIQEAASLLSCFHIIVNGRLHQSPDKLTVRLWAWGRLFSQRKVVLPNVRFEIGLIISVRIEGKCCIILTTVMNFRAINRTAYFKNFIWTSSDDKVRKISRTKSESGGRLNSVRTKVWIPVYDTGYLDCWNTETVQVFSSAILIFGIVRIVRMCFHNSAGIVGVVHSNTPLQLSSLILKIVKISSSCSHENFKPRFGFSTQTLF